MYNAFSQSLMKKYGWNEGDGLGKTNQGITQPIKATLKFNSHGLAYKEIDTEQESKWSNMFSSAVSNLQIENDNQITVLKTNTKEEKLNLSGVNILYKSFLKSTAVIKDGVEIKVKKPKKVKRKLENVEIANDSGKKLKIPNESDLVDGIISQVIKKKKKCKTNENKTSLGNLNENFDDFTELNSKESKLVNKSKKKKRKNSTDHVVYQENQTQEIDEKCKMKQSKKHKEIEITSNEQFSNEDNRNNHKLKDVETPESMKRDKKKKKRVKANEVQSNIQRKKKGEKEIIDKEKDLKEKQSVVVPDSTSMTCHTSARCGITMTGKLARIQKLYEEENLKSLSIKSVL